MDALGWWKQNEKELPLPAGVARSYLGVPMTSASSERMLSLGGRLVTDFRQNLNPENTSMLIFVSQNCTRIPSNLKDWEKICEGVSYELPHVPPPPPPPPTPEKTQQQRKSKSMTQTQNKTEKEVHLKRLFQVEYQKLKLLLNLKSNNSSKQTQSEDQTQSLTLLILMACNKDKTVIAKKQN